MLSSINALHAPQTVGRGNDPRPAELPRLWRDQWLPASALEQLQWRRFQRLLAHAWRHSPFYRQRLAEAGITPAAIRSRTDLAKIPPTTRDDLQDPTLFIAGNYLKRKLKSSFSSGSTGRPAQSFFDSGAWLLGKYLLKLRARTACGLRPWDRVAVCSESTAAGIMKSRLFRQRHFSVFDLSASTLAQLEKYRPSVFYGFPSYFMELAEQKTTIRPRLLFTSSEVLDRTTRERLQRDLGGEVFDVYGSSEFKEIAWECPAHEGYHLNSDWLLVEFTAEDGLPSAAGRILVTSLYNYAMPLIRYDTGDTGRRIAGGCSCGRGLPLMAPLSGRGVDYFILPGRRKIAPYQMTCAIEKVSGLRQFQLVQRQMDEVLVRIVSAIGREAAVAEGVREALGPILPGVHLSVDVVARIGRGAGGKHRPVSSQVEANG